MSLNNRFKYVWQSASPQARAAFKVVVIYLVYLVYAAIARAVVGREADTVFLLTGISRKAQFNWVTLLALLTLVVLTYRRFRALLNDSILGKADHRMASVLVAFLLVCINAVTSTIPVVLSDVAPSFVPAMYLWVTAGILAQLALTYLLLIVTPVFIGQVAILAVAGTLCIYVMNFSLASWFRSMVLPQQALSLLFTALALALLFTVLCKWRLSIRSTATVLCLTAATPVVGLAISPDNGDYIADLAPFRSLTLKSRPDIHIISIDSLAPPVLAEKFLDLSRVRYRTALGGRDVYKFENAFSSHVPTKWALNGLMRLSQTGTAVDFDYFAGRRPGPLTALLHGNNYKITTGFPVMGFLGFEGPYIDEYRYDPDLSLENNSLCALAHAPVATFYGFCGLAGYFHNPRGDVTPWTSRVAGMLSESLASTSEKPAFSYHHVLGPFGHTSLDFISDDPAHLERFRDYFVKVFDREAAAFIGDLVKRVQASRRKSIVILTGDHGLWLSRTFGFDADPKFFVHDRHGIVLALLKNDTGCDVL